MKRIAMRPCDHFDEQLLDYVYGLLNDEEAGSLRAHLAECQRCQAALTAAEGQQQLLSRAAQIYREVPLFKAPEEEPALAPVPVPPTTETEAAPAILPLPARARRRWGRWLGTAAAAAIAVAAAGLYALYQNRLDDYQTELTQANQQLKDTDGQLALVKQIYDRETAQLASRLSQESLHLCVEGSGTYSPEGASRFRAVTRDSAGNSMPADLDVRLVDADKKALFQAAVRSKGEVDITVPAGLKVDGSGARLEVAAQARDATARVAETLRIEEPTLVTHLTLNKSSFQIGEILFFRTVTLERFSLRPPAERVSLRYALVSPQGKVVRQVQGATGPGGIGGGEFALGTDLEGGDYTLEVSEIGGRDRVRAQRQRLQIARDQPPQVAFDRFQYRAGETARFQLQDRAAASPGRAVKIQAEVDGKPVPVAGAPGGMARTNAKGKAAFEVPLPPQIETGKAHIEMHFLDGDRRDKIVHNIPVVASRLEVDFFPEGGDLVAGLPNRVYYRVHTPLGDPVEPEGHVILLSGKTVLFDSPRGQGLGVFTFTPEINESYTLRLTSSQGVVEDRNPFGKLKIVERGIGLGVPEAVGKERDPVQVVVRNAGDERRLVLVATCRGLVVAQQFVTAAQGATEVALRPSAGANGVVRITLYEPRGGDLIPLAERLIYRAPAEHLRLEVANDKKTAPYLAGDSVKMTLRATSEEGAKTAVWFLAAVVDERARPGEGVARGLPAHFLLASGMGSGDDLENADLLLQDTPAARQALDLFLGTEGWRRFVTPAEAPALAKLGGKAGDRPDLARAEPVPRVFSQENASVTELAAAVQAKLRTAAEALRHQASQQAQALSDERDRRADAAALALARLREFQDLPRQYVRLGLGVLTLALLGVAALFLATGFLRLARRSGSPTSSFAVACSTLVVCLILYGVAGNRLGDSDLGQATRPAAKAAPIFPELQAEQTRRPLLPSAAIGTFAARSPSQSEREMEAKKGAAPGSAPEAFARKNNNVEALTFGALSVPREMTRADAKDAEARAGYSLSPDLRRRFFLLQQAQDQTAGADKLIAPPSDPMKGGVMAMSKMKTSGKSDPASRPATSGLAKAEESASPAQGAVLIREYAHKLFRSGPDFQDTLLWQPALFAPDGTVQFSFDLSQSVTSYRVLVHGHSPSGRLGTYQGELKVQGK
jgi:hypothetical protein